ncbi:GyrI-like domain-containing protein [Neobacillus mesonae]|nr:GyrI-like domain-containing protein [Neobacillus mesonae]
MDTYITSKPEMVVTGVGVRTTNAEEGGPNGKIPGLWNAYFRSNLAAEAAVNSHLLYSVYTDYESDASGAYTVILGHETSLGTTVAEENKSVVIPESKYLVFKTEKGPLQQVVAEGWREIWAYFQNSTEERTFTGDFELYDTRDLSPESTEVEIYIAIR